MGDDFDDRFDMIVPVEMARVENGRIALDLDEIPQAGCCVRPAGSTVRKGRLILEKGAVLRRTDLAALCVGGIESVPVFAKPTVAFIPTGSELVEVGTELTRGRCFDSNSAMVRPLLEELGTNPVMYGIVADVREELDRAILEAVEHADVVLVNGGTSKGRDDLNHPLLEERGELLSYWMACGPGRPLCVGMIDGKPVIIVPGPPLSAFNVLEYFVREAVGHWYGASEKLPAVRARLSEDIVVPAHMVFLELVDVVEGSDGLLAVPVPFKGDTIKALTASGYFHSPIGTGLHEAGSVVEVKMLSPMRSWRGEKLV